MGKKNSLYKGLKARRFKIHLETQKFSLAGRSGKSPRECTAPLSHNPSMGTIPLVGVPFNRAGVGEKQKLKKMFRL